MRGQGLEETHVRLDEDEEEGRDPDPDPDPVAARSKPASPARRAIMFLLFALGLASAIGAFLYKDRAGGDNAVLAFILVSGFFCFAAACAFLGGRRSGSSRSN